MSPTQVRLTKEARALVWPWAAVVLAGALQWVPALAGFARDWLVFAGFIGLFLGIPLLGTLSLGHEFQHGTLPLFLSQPVERTRLWAEKLIVVPVAVGSALLVYGPKLRLAFSDGPFRFDEPLSQFAGAMSLMVFLCSVTFWTLVARSTVGGMILNTFQIVTGVATAVFINLRVLGENPSPAALGTALYVSGGVAAAYALLMLWLGRRKFVGFEARGVAASGDFLTESPRMRGTLEAFLVCRPRGAWSNLVRKEVRLQWPLLLLTALTLLFLVVLVPFRFMPGAAAAQWMGTVAVGVTATYAVLVAVLAGTSSLGDERESGTHSWHMTIPFSVRAQWLVKLAVALLMSVVCVQVVVGAGELLLGAPYANNENQLPPLFFQLAVPVLTLAAFWFACAIKGTIRAALWVFPGVVAVGLAVTAGFDLAFWLGLTSAFGTIAATLYPCPITRDQMNAIVTILRSDFAVLLWALPAVVLGLVQSYRLFRTEAGLSIFSALPRLALLAFAAFLLSFSYDVPALFVYGVEGNARVVLGEVATSIDRMQIDPAELDAANPLELTLEDLARVSPPSEIARRWLEGARITVTPMAFTLRTYRNGRQRDEEFSHFATVHLRNDWSCAVYESSWPSFACSSPEGSWRRGDIP